MNHDWERVFLGFGGNIGNVPDTIRKAVNILKNMDNISLIRISSLYRTAPMYDISQPDFINAVAEFNVNYTPYAILEIIHELENEFGRKRDSQRRYGPRTLDIDILFWGDRIIREESLIIPHKEFSKRKFVLEPMGEIALNYRVPGTQKTIRDFLKACPDQSRVEKI
jgi:2-amino-4-hydroxy-6-hydroxymethyldihydropteridine diphosphokinase